MRILHTSDWHLGHVLHDRSREFEHARFLEWLLDTIEAELVDALLVAGDIFETANPPAAAQQMWFEFLARARGRFPRLGIVVIGGNHDSAARLEAPVPILDPLGVHVVGGLACRSNGSVMTDRLVVPLADRTGTIRAWVAAVPYLRQADLSLMPQTEGDPLVEGVRRVYSEVLHAARSRREVGQALVAMGHCYMTGATLTELSERKILGGNQHALPADIFPDDVAYGALGHLHLAQSVGGRENLRYSGSPIPLSMAETGYCHQVCLVDLDGEQFTVHSLPIPRSVSFLQLPADGPQPLPNVLALLAGLPPRSAETPEERRPYLEVRVSLDKPQPDLRRRIDEALRDRDARLVKLTVEHSGVGQSLAEAMPGTTLADLDPEAVFLKRYQRDHRGGLPPDLLDAFHELVETVRRDA